MYYIEHTSFGPLTNEGDTNPLTFDSALDAETYLESCGETGPEWSICRVL